MSVLLHFGFLWVPLQWHWYSFWPVKVSGKNSRVTFECCPNMLCLALSLNTFEVSVTAVVSLSMIRRLCCHTVVRVQYSLWVVIRKFHIFQQLKVLSLTVLRYMDWFVCFIIFGFRLSIAPWLQWHRFWNSSNLNVSNPPASSWLKLYIVTWVFP
jgi:hypothetical protein